MARHRGDRSGLGVPIVVAEEVVCALVLWSRRSSRGWSEPVLERVRLIAEILAVALQRCRQETALRASVATIERLNARLAADNVYLQEEIKTYHDFDEIVGEGASLRLALTRLGQVAPMNSSVLLLGETGTGKELFARAVHDRSRRRMRTLVQGQLRGASADAGRERALRPRERGVHRRRLDAAGTLRARRRRDDLPGRDRRPARPKSRPSCCGSCRKGEFERVGSSRTKRVDVRVIAATHRDLEADVASGRFRADLYYRLSVFPIYLPALRERLEDIPSLVWFFIQRLQRGARPPDHQSAAGRDVGAAATFVAGQRSRAGECRRAGDDSIDG